jgi:hypothetical protein
MKNTTLTKENVMIPAAVDRFSGEKTEGGTYHCEAG